MGIEQLHTELNSGCGRSVHARGFTLIEIMVVVTIIAMMLVIGLPGMSEFVADQRVRTMASDITSEIALARGKAMESSRRVYMQKLGVNWNNGWRLYADINDNAAYDAGVGGGGAPAVSAVVPQPPRRMRRPSSYEVTANNRPLGSHTSP